MVVVSALMVVVSALMVVVSALMVVMSVLMVAVSIQQNQFQFAIFKGDFHFHFSTIENVHGEAIKLLVAGDWLRSAGQGSPHLESDKMRSRRGKTPVFVKMPSPCAQLYLIRFIDAVA